MTRPLICPFCGSDSKALFEKFGVPIRACTCCDLRFADFDITAEHLQTHYGDDYFSGGKAGYVDYAASKMSLIRRGEEYAAIVARHVADGGNQSGSQRRVLDVGAAAGYVLKGFANAGWIGEGLEPNRTMAEQGHREFGFPIHHSGLEDFQPAERYDLVSLLQVLSHFTNPIAAIEKVATLLNPNGHCLVETWNYRSLTARLGGHAWHQYSPPSVLFWYTPRLIDDVFAKAGFRKLATGRAGKRITGEHAKALAAHADNGSFSGGVVRSVAGLIPDRLSVPYPGNDCFWALYELNSK